MAKFAIECPKCGRFAEAKTGFWIFGTTKKIDCACGNVIDVKADKISSRICPHCMPRRAAKRRGICHAYPHTETHTT
jgi:hypothetical protein